MKKTVAIVLVLLVAMTCALAFAGCNNDDGDGVDNLTPFVGAISQTTYDSVEDAVKGFLQDEYSGQYFRAQYTDYDKISDFTQDEIEELSIDEGLKDGIIGAYMIEIQWIQQWYGYDTFETSMSERELCILEYDIDGNECYRYYFFAEKVGEFATLSSIRYLFDVDKFLNSTWRCEAYRVQENGERGEYITNSITKYTENELYSYMWEITFFPEEYTYYEYSIIYNNVRYEAEREDDEDWYVYRSGDYDFQEYILYLVERELYSELSLVDTLYIKTETGYEEVFLSANNSLVSSKRIININEGKVEVSWRWIKNESTAFDYVYTFYDFGKTKVEVPQDLTNAIKAYQAQN